MSEALVETAVEAFADEPPERRVALADEGAEALLDDLAAESARGDRRHEAACAHVRLTLQEAALFGEPTVGLRGAAALDTDALERVNAERRTAVEAGVEDPAAGQAKRHAILRDLGGEPRDRPRYLG